ncbi:unnamed protein product [Pleuronectes platessa]|uniref:Uncharacterized protein n=1 Tax=Pleuronectes platessa TaxID=8262 RepID=A0A9N7ZDT4_PLEPL|nr:unnamed protein product [Pleuronectes platessa]
MNPNFNLNQELRDEERRWTSGRNLDYGQKRSLVRLHGETTKRRTWIDLSKNPRGFSLPCLVPLSKAPYSPNICSPGAHPSPGFTRLHPASPGFTRRPPVVSGDRGRCWVQVGLPPHQADTHQARTPPGMMSYLHHRDTSCHQTHKTQILTGRFKKANRKSRVDGCGKERKLEGPKFESELCGDGSAVSVMIDALEAHAAPARLSEAVLRISSSSLPDRCFRFGRHTPPARPMFIDPAEEDGKWQKANSRGLCSRSGPVNYFDSVDNVPVLLM